MAENRSSPSAYKPRILRALGRLARDERGAELIEFALVLPILIGVLWTFYQAWQLISLRGAVQAAVAQASRYVGSYAALGNTADLPNRRDPGLALPDPPTAQQIEDTVNRIIADALRDYQSAYPTMSVEPLVWYRVLDPTNPNWDTNIAEIPSQQITAWLAGLECTDPAPHFPQFVLRISVRVPWRTVIFGSAASPRIINETLDFTEYAQGVVTCYPRCTCELRAWAVGCTGRMNIQWSFSDCSYRPSCISVEMDGFPYRSEAVNMLEGFVTIPIPARGVHHFRVRAYSGQHRLGVLDCETIGDYSCPP